MKKTLIVIASLVSSTSVMAAETPQAQWQPAAVQPGQTVTPTPQSAGSASAPPVPMPPDAALQYAEMWSRRYRRTPLRNYEPGSMGSSEVPAPPRSPRPPGYAR